ncbi:MAG: NAD(+) diphosphatase, partial [Pseudomonadota bacterium]
CPEAPDFPAIWCVFRAGQVLVRRIRDVPGLPAASPGELGVDPAACQYLGTLDGQHCFAAYMSEQQPLPPGTQFISMRSLILEADEWAAAVAGRAFQIIEWDRTHRYCGNCGEATTLHASDRARECRRCRAVYYPRISPVVMALVTRGRQLLLTRKPGYAAGRYTVVAGFVEPGETLEHALAREVREETGVATRNPLYFGSQPWPFPNSLVMAFSLEYAGGEARADGTELEDARWFDVDALPELPEPVHISRQLIDAAIARLRGARLSLK